MTSDETRRRAEAHGVATGYLDWHGRRVEVSQRTLDAILAALGEAADQGATVPAVAEGPEAEELVDDGPVVAAPEERSWGFAVQLYSVRSRQSWGFGDLGDLADLAAWSAT